MTPKHFRAKILQSIQYWAIPALLITVAGRQIVLVHTDGLSPWHGGGFGMFASIDRDERRLITLQTTDCQGDQITQVLTPEAIGLDTYTWRQLTTVPRQSELKSLGYQLLEKVAVDEASASLFNLSDACSQPLEIQVWRLRYDPASGQMWYAPVTPVVEVQS